MPFYEYRARDSRGKAVQGRIEANSPDAVATQLFNMGMAPIDIRESAVAQAAMPINIDALLRRAPRLDDMIFLFRQLHALASAGIPIIRGLAGLAETTRNPLLSQAVRRLPIDLESGRDLSTAMAQHPQIFSSIMLNMVRVGENSGRLDEAFLQLAAYLEFERDTRARVRAALRYPVIVLLVMVVAVAVINLKVIPAFANTFASMSAELPWQTKLLIACSDFTVAYWPHLLSTSLALVMGFRYYITTPKGRFGWDKIKLRLPIVGGLVQKATLARFARSFSMTSRSGVPLLSALTSVAKAVDNEFVAERVQGMRAGIERGESLTRTATGAELFTPLVLQMLSVGEETGRVEAMLEEVGRYYEREVDYQLKNLTSAIEPILIAGVAGLVLILALGVFLPMWELANISKG